MGVDTICSDVGRIGRRTAGHPSFTGARAGGWLAGICLLALLFTVLISGALASDVASAAELNSGPSITSLSSSPTEKVKPLITGISKNYRCTAKYSTLQSGADSYAIGNCKEGETLEAVVGQPLTEKETYLYSIGGFVGGNFQGCAWLEVPVFNPAELSSKPKNACTQLVNSPHDIPTTEFMRGVPGNNEHPEIDGVEVVNPVPCREYANYRPWSAGNIETEFIRELPAYSASELGSRTPALLWRYVTKYESKDGSEEPYVMVHDARISVGEGEWVFVPRSCLPASLPQGKGEQLPLKPTIATGTASGVTTSQATLNGTVNPNGIEATYYFEYGTSTSYGGLTYPGDAGTGGVTEPESYSISGLMPGTTYHYRIMAYSDTGLSEGTDQTFTTQALPPEVSTSPASEVQQAQATLNGTVNPKSTDTHYYFEYGKTTEYGTDVPALPGGDAGSGASSVAVSATATGLEAGVTYHYRLFASNTGGLERGSDQTYTTPVPTIAFQATSDTLWSDSSASAGGWSNTTMGMRENTSPSIAALPEGKYVVAFQAVNGTKGELWTYSSNGEYHNTQLGMEPGTSPSVVALPEGKYVVAFQAVNGTKGELWTYSSNGEYHNTQLGMEPGTSPSVVALPEGKYVVAFQASSGELWTYSSSGEYHGTTLGMKSGTSPSVTALPNGKYVVAFQASSGELWTYSSSGEYHGTTLGMEPGTSPSVTALPEGKYVVAFQAVNGSKGELWTYSSNGEYHNTTLGMEPGTSPSVTALPEGKYVVAFQASSGELWTYSSSGGGWFDSGLGVKSGTSPSIIELPEGNYMVAFQVTGGELWTYASAPPGDWLNTQLGMEPGTSPSVTALPEGKYVVAFQASSGELWTYSSSGEYHGTTLGMKSGTSPSVTALPEGKYVVAFQASSGELWTYSSSGEYHGTTLGMKSGTSPSVTALSGGKYVVAFQASSGELWTYSSSGEYHGTTLGMKSGTSPSVTALSEGKYVVAFQAVNGSKGELWTYSSNGEYHNTQLGMEPGTSPSVTALPEGKYVVAFQAVNGSKGELWTYSSNGEYHNTQLGMEPGTSPSVAAVPQGKYEVAFQASSGELWTYSSNGEYHDTTLGVREGTSPSIEE